MNQYIAFGLATVAMAVATDRASAFGRGGGRGGVVGGGYARPAAVSPYGGHATTLPASGGVRSGSGSYTTTGGATIKYGGAGVSGTTPGGINYGRGVGGIQVTGSGGQTVTRVGSGGVAQGPGGTTVGGTRGVGVATGPGGTAVTGHRTGAAVGPGGAVVAGGTRVGGVSTANGTWTGAAHGGVAFGPYGGVAVRGGAVATGPGGTVARHGTFYATPSFVAGRGTVVRNGFAYHTAYFNTGWYTAHPAAWRAAGLTAAAIWATATYASVASYCGAPADPVPYDYGSTIVYQGDDVYQDGEKVATTEEYATQAEAIADTGRDAKPPADEEWKPLGVFGMVQGEETVANTMFQLAVNKAGVIRGNYYDALGDNTLPVFGSVDKKTGRAAWSVGEKKEIVYEAGLSNLTQPESTVLIHYGKERSRQMILVRLEDPKAGEQPPPK
jgi:hypothetical protein